MPRVIVVDGNICAGKTTLIKNHLRRLLPDAKIFLEPNSSNNPYLDKFYKEPKKFIVMMQQWFMAHRLEKYVTVLDAKPDDVIIMDRSIYSDYVFIKNALKSGIMSESQYINFMACREDTLFHMQLPSMILYLDVSPENCYERVHNLRKEACESTISLDYLQGIHECYQEYIADMKKKGVRVEVIDWNLFDINHVDLDSILLEKLNANANPSHSNLPLFKN